jgi:hypothetical protein
MATRKTTSGGSKKASPGHVSLQKQRSEPDRERARASGGGLRSQPAEAPAGRSASTGGRASKASVRSNGNSRSSKR